jgi:hypothetical protein
MSERANLYVRYKPNLNLVVISTDDNRKEGEATLMSLSPTEAFHLGNALMEHGKQHGGAPT